MAGFHEVRLPVGISYGAVGGPKFKTTVATFDSGEEIRNVDWENARAEYDVAYAIQRGASKDDLLAFFRARRGRAYGFRFRDWTDYTLDRQSIGTGDGVDATWQIYKRYADDALVYDRDLKKIVADADVVAQQLQVWVNDVLQTEATHYTVDRNTGIITFTGGNEPAMGHDIEVACEFDVPVRFDVDDMQLAIDNYDIHSWGSIVIVEVRV